MTVGDLTVCKLQSRKADHDLQFPKSKVPVVRAVWDSLACHQEFWAGLK